MPPKQAGCASWPAEAIHLEDVMFVADRPTTAVDNYININRINAARWRQTGYGSDRNRCACRCDHTPYIRKTRWLGGGEIIIFLFLYPRRRSRYSAFPWTSLAGKYPSKIKLTSSNRAQKYGRAKGKTSVASKRVLGCGNPQTLDTCHSSLPSPRTETCGIGRACDFPEIFAVDV